MSGRPGESGVGLFETSASGSKIPAGIREGGEPVLLNRGMISPVEELLLSAEHILATGDEAVVLCK
ncbi:MAG: hypothetical protein HY287_10915 [Planctomycetes bacterium]|nr:hypothetical protein [Planctomycetota bacterium]MBI3834830.1 hypothetical protein [Planctomycetota bacterium]